MKWKTVELVGPGYECLPHYLDDAFAEWLATRYGEPGARDLIDAIATKLWWRDRMWKLSPPQIVAVHRKAAELVREVGDRRIIAGGMAWTANGDKVVAGMV